MNNLRPNVYNLVYRWPQKRLCEMPIGERRNRAPRARLCRFHVHDCFRRAQLARDRALYVIGKVMRIRHRSRSIDEDRDFREEMS